MSLNKAIAPTSSSGRNDGSRLKDEVYRQMFRLESHRPGAERDLAVALLRACTASYSLPRTGIDRLWLKKICPICMAMIETAIRTGEVDQRQIQ
jgi:hypothetical protein